ncbi:sulfotransferase family 2 domain-containing protein [Phaeobacter sp. J2-8]|uniref:sulfotransferase family 2 domain-containing protein n=1 Tax=Phaeobacter sp. J2-8 TaxID=2931394 RepID=UPI001FD3CC24|nr:sulfotransferase family protein [Phaeobacter sp. J2-8]
MTGLLRYARQEDVTLSTNKAHTHAAHYAQVHYKSGAIYSFIPKNACSTLRYSMARANNCLAGPEDWTWIHLNNGTFSATLPDLVRAPFSFVVLRCPHARLASVFLDKIVDKTPELWQLYRLTRDGFDPDELTFRDFVTLLDEDNLLLANIHWRPQVDFLVFETYSRVFALENFRDAIPTLREDIGFEVHDARALTGHGTDRVALLRTGNFSDMPLAELAAQKRAGKLQAHAQLFDDALSARVAGLYQADMAFYAAHLDAQMLTFPEFIET